MYAAGCSPTDTTHVQHLRTEVGNYCAIAGVLYVGEGKRLNGSRLRWMYSASFKVARATRPRVDVLDGPQR